MRSSVIGWRKSSVVAVWFVLWGCGGSNNISGDAGSDVLADTGLPPPPDCSDEDNQNNGSPEICDGHDNDCDGDIDEHVDMLCGTDCSEAPKLNCSGDDFPPSGDGWDEPGNDNSTGGVILDDDGNITLGSGQAEYYHVWVANTDEGTVSKLDAETGKELARYASVIAKSVSAHNGEVGTIGRNKPSRTAVDQDGNAYVANRAFGYQGTVTKFADYSTGAQRDANCVDHDDSGDIQTSSDVDEDGMIDITDPQEFLGLNDECILWTVDVGGVDGMPRALAVGLNRDGAPGFVWVGLNGQNNANLRSLVALDPEDGEIAKRGNNSDMVFSHTDIGDFAAYGAVTDREGKIWWVDRHNKNGIGYVSADGTTWTYADDLPASTGYGITADRDGRIYIALWDHATDIAYRYDPTASAGNRWTAVVGTEYGRGRGVAVDSEHLWVAVSNTSGGAVDSRVVQYNLSDLTLVDDHPSIGCNIPIGVGISLNGLVWAICNQNVNNKGNAAFYDPASGIWDTWPVGQTPYTYSDFTGFNLNFIAENGTYRFTAEGCDGGQRTQWEGLVIAEGFISAETPVSVSVRAAASVAALEDVEYSEVMPVTQIGQAIVFDPVLQGQVLQVRISLETNNPEVLPKIKNIQLIKSCFQDTF